MTAYQLVFNSDECFGYCQEALYDCDICPQIHFEDIVAQIYAKLEQFGVNFVALNMERGTHVHMHAYVQVAYKVQSMAAWQKLFPGVHVETCRGTPAENMDYLAKSGKWADDEKHGTLKWGPFQTGELLDGTRGTPRDYVALAMKADSCSQVFAVYPEAIRYSYAIQLIIRERMQKNASYD